MVSAFLVVEHDGPWGTDIATAPRFDEAAHLAEASRSSGVRVLLTRRHRRGDRGGRRVFAAHVPSVRMEAGDVGDLRALDLTDLAAGRSLGLPPATAPYLGVCTHGRHDPCCAERGRPVAAALSRSHPELTWEVSHIGGDRFAANLLVLPYGLYYGRVGVEQASRVADLAMTGRISLPHYRGRAGWPMPAQYAEIELRRGLGLDAVGDVRLVSVGSSPEGLVEALLAVGDRRWRAVVRRSSSTPVRLTCRASLDNPVPSYEVNLEEYPGAEEVR